MISLLVGPVRGRAEHRPLALGIRSVERVHRERDDPCRPGGVRPWATTGAPGAPAAVQSNGARPERKKPVNGSVPSAVIVPGSVVNHVGGSTIAESLARYAPVMTLPAPPELFQLMIPL